MSTVTKTQIDGKKKVLKEAKSKLDRMGKEAKQQRKRRAKLRDNLNKVCEENPEATKLLKSFNRNVFGRPRAEVDQPWLLSAIINIVQASSTADERRRSELLRTVTTLDDLVKELRNLGYNLSRSASYLRLLPCRGNTEEGKRHVQTVPVKLLRPENSLRKKNIDRAFAKSFIDDMFDIAKLFGPCYGWSTQIDPIGVWCLWR